MIRTSLNEIIHDSEVNAEILDGLLSVLLLDIESEDHIKAFGKELDIEGNLLINLMDLTSADTQRFPQIVMDLLSTNPAKEESKLC